MFLVTLKMNITKQLKLIILAFVEIFLLIFSVNLINSKNTIKDGISKDSSYMMQSSTDVKKSRYNSTF